MEDNFEANFWDVEKYEYMPSSGRLNIDQDIQPPSGNSIMRRSGQRSSLGLLREDIMSSKGNFLTVKRARMPHLTELKIGGDNGECLSIPEDMSEFLSPNVALPPFRQCSLPSPFYLPLTIVQAPEEK